MAPLKTFVLLLVLFTSLRVLISLLCTPKYYLAFILFLEDKSSNITQVQLRYVQLIMDSSWMEGKSSVLFSSKACVDLET